MKNIPKPKEVRVGQLWGFVPSLHAVSEPYLVIGLGLDQTGYAIARFPHGLYAYTSGMIEAGTWTLLCEAPE